MPIGCAAAAAGWGDYDAMNLKDHIRGVPDFPKPGILFYDISTLLANAGAWRYTVDRLAEALRPAKPDILAGIESRGFLVAAPLALELGIGFIMVRKKGKLPGPTIPHTYDLEYGTDTVDIQQDAVHRGQRIVVVDAMLATGGTMTARSEEHTSELQSLMRISYAVFCLQKKKKKKNLH